MRILHINVRLSEGGAARIALDLHARALAAGHDSQFIYGYGAGADKSAFEGQVEGAIHVGTKSRVILNYACHRLAGLEFVPPENDKADILGKAIRRADVVHLHAIHSYFLPFEWFSEMLAAAKHIVWTCHDFWPITGRCAFLEGCEGWRRGCGVCPSGKNYPPALLDFSAMTFKSRREALLRHIDRIVFAAPSDFVRDRFIEALPDARVLTVRNGIDVKVAEAARKIHWGAAAPSGRLKVAVMANDLSDPTKIDVHLVGKIASMAGIELHTIGRKSPFRGEHIVNHGGVVDREKMVRIMQGMDLLVFTSQKDTFGLVMIEAMVCGVPVLALRSEAACEVLGLVGGRVANSPDELLYMVNDRAWWNAYRQQSRQSLHQNVLSIFSGDAMFKSYFDLYTEGCPAG